MAKALRFLLTSLLIGNVCSEGTKTAVIEVKNGATLYLRKSHLNITGNSGEACKVQVVENEPMYQRVGKFTPKIFDCDFSKHSVRYQHNGSPFLSEDQVKLRISRLLDTETIQETMYIRIRILNADCEVIKPGHRQLVVTSMNGFSNPLRKDVVLFNHDRLFRTKCEVRVAYDDHKFPEIGRLVVAKKSDPRSYEPLTLKWWDCDEFLSKEIRYQHMIPPAPDIDYIPLHAVVKDARSRYVLKQEYHWVPVRIEQAFPNEKPRGAPGSSHIMEVDQFVTTNLLSTTMSAKDSETRNEHLVFNITKPPEHGFIVHLNDESKPIESFYQQDISDLKIAYRPPNSNYPERRTFCVEFIAIDSRFANSQVIRVWVSVRVSHTTAPRISWNTGLTMLEGQSRKINKDCLQVFYHGSLDLIRMTLAGGPQHGRLLVDGKPAYSFSWNQIENHDVIYQHDDSDTLQDHIMFEMSDLRSRTRFKLPVEILPKDDSPPTLVNNLVIEGEEGQIIHLYTFILEALDEDSSSDFVRFNITNPPKAGMIQKRKQGESSGWNVHQFEQQDLNKGNIIYKHSGDEVFQDSFDFVLMDSADPYPNVSPLHTARIRITPVDDQPPIPAEDITKFLTVNETDIAIITSDMLSYIDEENPKSPLIYAVTVDVSVLESKSNMIDAGQLFNTDDMVMPMKSPGIAHLKNFTQDAVDHNKVAYMPPLQDVGIHPLSVYFLYSVRDIHGTALDKEQFLITVLPVDNQAPELKLVELSLREGGSRLISQEDILIKDPDTASEDMTFIVKSPPKYGKLQRSDISFTSGDTFTYSDLLDFTIQYSHDGYEQFFDSFELLASDGYQNSSVAATTIVIQPIDDEIPVFGDSGKLYVNETDTATISTQHLSATDLDTNDDDLIFYIIAHPIHGTVLLHGEPITSFSQLDIKNGDVAYKHDGREIGYSIRMDVISFIVEDRSLSYGSDDLATDGENTRDQNIGEILDVNVEIIPVNNRPPEIVIGSAVFHCDEGGKHVIDSSHIWATDLDTSPEKLIFKVSNPEFGYLEDRTPREGYEKQISVPINTFTLQKLKDGKIQYVQSKHRGIEPTIDTFNVQVTDGKHPSAEIPFLVAIIPMNDEAPNVKSSNFSCSEGGMFSLNEAVLQIVDLDVPANEVMVSVFAPPEHGMLFDEMEMKSSRSRKRSLDHSHLMHEMDHMTEFSMHDWSRHMVKPAYLNDGTENSHDSFRLKINDGRHTYMTDMTVNILMVNDEKPSIVTNKGISVELGDNAVLSGVVLHTTDGDNSNDELMYIIQSIPSQGRLQRKEGDEWIKLDLSDAFTEQELADNRIRYLHTDVLSSRSRDSFRFSVTDGTWTTRRENFLIKIQNKNRGAIHIVTGPIEVKEGDTAYITTQVLTAKDGFDRPEEMSYEVITQPAYGQLEHVVRPFEKVTVFTQMDLMSRKILYRHQSKEDSLFDTFVAEAGNGIETKEAAVSIDILPVDVVRPTVTLFPNMESIGGSRILTIFRGASMTINDMTIAVSDPDTTKDKIVLSFSTLPEHGSLTVGHQTITHYSPNVTLTELENDELMYENNGDMNAIDRFSFIVTDGVNAGYNLGETFTNEPSTINIQIEELDNTPPTVLLNIPTESIEMLGSKDYAVYIDSHHLMAVDEGSVDGEGIIFYISEAPTYGVLKRKEDRGRLVPASDFSINDLKMRKVLYTINGKHNVTNDSFVFDIQDDWGNMRIGHRFSMSWARIELVHESIVLCENTTASVSIKRYGNLHSSAFIGAKVVFRNSAEEGQDFTISNARQIQFDPGFTQKEWFVSAIDDGMQERKEKFKMLLHAPVNAVLETKHKDCVITIIDSRSRSCRQNNLPIVTGKRKKKNSRKKKKSKKNGRKSSQMRNRKRKSQVLARDEAVDSAPRSKTRKYGKLPKPAKVQPVSYYSNSTHRKWQYHAILPITIDEEKTERIPSTNDREPTTDTSNTLTSNPVEEELLNDGPPQPNTATGSFHAREQPGKPSYQMQCTRQMQDRLYYNEDTKILLICNGATWVPLSPTVLKASSPTDQPRCDDEWHFYQDKCFYIHPATSIGESWNSAQRKCREEFNAHLATISSKKHMNWLRRKAEKMKLWIGLNRKITKDWTWPGGDKVTYANWKHNYSTVKKKGGKPVLKCTLITERKKWTAKVCEVAVPMSGFVCMKQANL